jgi:hypothetical protein
VLLGFILVTQSEIQMDGVMLDSDSSATDDEEQRVGCAARPHLLSISISLRLAVRGPALPASAGHRSHLPRQCCAGRRGGAAGRSASCLGFIL